MYKLHTCINKLLKKKLEKVNATKPFKCILDVFWKLNNVLS